MIGLFSVKGNLLLGIITLYALIKFKKRKRDQQILIDKIGLKNNFFHVRYSSQNKFERLLKYYPWQYSGVLYINKMNDLVFCYIGPCKNIYEKIFEIDKCQSEWVGRDFINGLTSWFSIERDNELHYFTSETGVFIFKSNSTTKDMYTIVKKVTSANSRLAT